MEAWESQPVAAQQPPPPLAAAPRLGVGAALGEIFTHVGRGWWRLLLLGFLGLVPWGVVSALAVTFVSMRNGPEELVLVTVLGVLLVFLLVAPFISGAMMACADRQLRGERPTLRDALARAGRRYLSLLGLHVLVGLTLAVVYVVAIMVMAMVGAAFGPRVWVLSFAALIVAFLGFLWMVARILTRWAVSAPAALLEQRGPLAALRRSRELTQGHRLAVFLVFLVPLLGWFLVFLALEVGVFTLSFGPGRNVEGGGPLIVVGLLVSALNLVLLAVLAVGPVVVHHRLRAANGESDAGQLAQVFE
ncbi:MAG: hypothetical protein QM767_08835 [Anaeromyxobacter sp.]